VTKGGKRKEAEPEAGAPSQSLTQEEDAAAVEHHVQSDHDEEVEEVDTRAPLRVSSTPNPKRAKVVSGTDIAISNCPQ
jgi:hypothetical protein